MLRMCIWNRSTRDGDSHPLFLLAGILFVCLSLSPHPGGDSGYFLKNSELGSSVQSLSGLTTFFLAYFDEQIT